MEKTQILAYPILNQLVHTYVVIQRLTVHDIGSR